MSAAAGRDVINSVIVGHQRASKVTRIRLRGRRPSLALQPANTPRGNTKAGCVCFLFVCCHLGAAFTFLGSFSLVILSQTKSFPFFSKFIFQSKASTCCFSADCNLLSTFLGQETGLFLKVCSSCVRWHTKAFKFETSYVLFIIWSKTGVLRVTTFKYLLYKFSETVVQ